MQQMTTTFGPILNIIQAAYAIFGRHNLFVNTGSIELSEHLAMKLLVYA